MTEPKTLDAQCAEMEALLKAEPLSWKEHLEWSAQVIKSASTFIYFLLEERKQQRAEIERLREAFAEIHTEVGAVLWMRGGDHRFRGEEEVVTLSKIISQIVNEALKGGEA